MREIKFRAWDKKGKELLSHKEMLDIGYNLSYEEVFKTGIDDFPIMQYTGLKDKNIESQKEVYAGDIVQFINGNIGTVEWDYKNTGWIVRSTKNKMKTQNLVDSLLLCALVVGNIYENPELLEDN